MPNDHGFWGSAAEVDDGAADGTMPEDLAALFDALPPSIQKMFSDWKVKPTESWRARTDLCTRALRAQKWSLENAIRLAPYFPTGFGSLNTYAGVAIAERWGELEAEDARRDAEKDERHNKIARQLTIKTAAWDPETLPPRPWLARPYLMRGELTLPHGPGGSGKSQLAIAWAVALALGKPFGRFKPEKRSRVILTNFEDGEDEQTRRLTAALEYFNAKPSDLDGWLYRVSVGSAGDATMFNVDEFGAVQTTECWEALELACEDIAPDAIFLDPLVAINEVPEANNTLMRRVMVVMKQRMAQQFNAAVVVVHHDNKSSDDSDASDQNNARGAGDIVNAVRFELAVKKMTTSQAEQWGIPAAQRGYYFRVGSPGSKVNYSAPEESEWFERIATPINGEDVVRCLPWTPPTGRLDDKQASQVVAAVEKGTPSGPYSPQLGNTERSLAPVFTAIGITTPRAQRLALSDLMKSGRILKAQWKIPGRGNNTLAGLRSDARLPYNYEWYDGDES